MLCQKCGLTKATVHRETTVFRQKIEEHVCELCAGVGINTEPYGMAGGPQRDPVIEGELDFTVAPDPVRPTELRLPPTISVQSLSDLLCIKPFKTVAILMQLGVFAALDQEIEFALAAKVCAYCGVAALGP